MTNMMMNGVVAINGGVGVMEIRQPLPQTVESVAQPVENLTVNAHISLRELKNTVAAVIEKKLPKYAQLMEMHPVIAARTVVGGAKIDGFVHFELLKIGRNSRVPHQRNGHLQGDDGARYLR